MNETRSTTVVPPPGRPEIRRLTRSSEGRVIAGVGRGLANYTGMDPVVFRVGFIVLAIAGGTGIFAYLLMWLAVPLDSSPRATERPGWTPLHERRWIPLVLIALAVVIFLYYTGLGSPLVIAVMLVAVGIVLLNDAEPSSAPAPTDALAVPDGARVRVRRERSPLGLYTIGAALLAVGVAAALVGTGAMSLGLGQYFALALIVIGAGLVLGAWWGRSRWLILFGILLIPIMVVGSVIEMPLRGRLGDQYISSRRHLADRYDVLAGSITLDLSRFKFGGEPEVVDVNIVLGHLRVYVPPGVDVSVGGAMDVGQASVFGDRSNGYDLAFGGTYRRNGSTEGDLVVNVQGGLARVTMTWANWVEQEIRFRERERARKLEKQQAVEGARHERGEQRRRDNRGD